MKLEEIEAAALKLDLRSRASLAQMLLQSLDDVSEADNARLWGEEADRRDAELDADPSSERPGSEVMKRVRSKLR